MKEGSDDLILAESSTRERPVSPKMAFKNANSNIDLEENDKSVTKILLSELRNIKISLIKSSIDIERVFRMPLSHLKLNVRGLLKFRINLLILALRTCTGKNSLTLSSEMNLFPH